MDTEVPNRKGWLVPWRRWLAPQSKNASIGDVIGAFESETMAVFVNTAPTRAHKAVYVLSAGVIIAVILSSVVNLDIVVSGTGKVAPVSGQIYISPFATGIVKTVNVKAGDYVKTGQTLATLDPTFTQADLLQLQEHLASDEAVVAREQAEVAGLKPNFSDRDPYQKFQAEIWRKRHEEYQSNLNNYDGQIHSSEALVAQYKGDMLQYTQRLKLAGEVEKVYKPLLEQGYVSKLQAMTATDTRTEMTRLLSDAKNLVDSNTQTLAALKAQREAYIQKWHSDTGVQLVTDSNDLDTTRQQLDKAQKMRDLVNLDSPEDALVLKVGKVHAGSVYSGGGTDALTPGTDPLFTLMPVNAPLFADVWIPSQDIGFVKIGHQVRMKLDAYRYLEYGVAKGVVKTISENSFSTDDNNQAVPPYFKVHVEITEVKLRGVPKTFRLLPGDTMTGDIMVSKRTIMSYIVEGVMRQTSEAMREP
jgi:hemolysin D